MLLTTPTPERWPLPGAVPVVGDAPWRRVPVPVLKDHPPVVEDPPRLDLEPLKKDLDALKEKV